MPDLKATRPDPASAFRHGLMVREGEEVGFWYARGHDRSTPGISRMWRGPEGAMHGGTHVLRDAHESDVGGCDADDGFGVELLRLIQVANIIPRPDGGSRDVDPTDPDADASSAGYEWKLAGVVIPADFRLAAARYVETLDRQAVSLVARHLRHAEVLGRSWRAIDAGAGDAVLARALSRHPGFPAQVLAIHDEAGDEGLRDLLDRGRLGSRIAAKLVEQGIPRSMIPLAAKAEAALSALAVTSGHGYGAMSTTFPDLPGDPWPVNVAMQLVGLPGGWAPRDDAEWTAFAHVVPVIRNLRQFVADGGMANALDAGCGWETCRERLLDACGTDDTDGILCAIQDTEDMVDAYAIQVLAPAAHVASRTEPDREPRDGDLHATARTLLFGGRSLAGILKLSLDWHRRQHGMRAAVVSMDGGYVNAAAWPKGLPDAIREGVEVRVLGDAPSLAASSSPWFDEEGVTGLDNCAAGYDRDCLSGRIRILELRRKGAGGVPHRLSMAEIDVTDAPRLVAHQHVGTGNGKPPEDARRALAAYLRDVSEGVLPVDVDAFEPVPEDDVDPLTRSCGFDPSVEGTRLAVARLWDRYLPREWRGVEPVEAFGIPVAACDGWSATTPRRDPSPRVAPPDDGPPARP